jgi:DNA-binding beta-propeller fold protein YncE
MPLRLCGHIDLPRNEGKGGFDHADIHVASDRLYVAHTSNNALDVIDCARERYVESVPGLTGVAGALVSESRGLVFTSNRGENTVSIFRPGAERAAIKIPVGVKPNGLSFDAKRGILIAANVGDPAIPDSFTLSVVDVDRKERIAEMPVPGRTRWTVYDPVREMFYVNIASPAKILAIDARNPGSVCTAFDIPAAGPHGLDLDRATGRLFCACDAGVLVVMDAASGRVLGEVALSGAPDVIFLQHATGYLYVAIGDPGVIDVIDTKRMLRVQTMDTEAGAHTLALDRKRTKVFAFLPKTHRAAIYQEGP